MRGVRIRVKVFCLLAGLFVAVLPPLFSQITTADLSGHVLDPKGLAVPNAQVHVENLATGLERAVYTDPHGEYALIALPPGNYRMNVLARGFATLVNRSLVLTIGQKAVYNPSLQLAARARTVTVTGGPDLIDTTQSANSTTIVGRQIDNLPINERDYINFTLLASPVKRDDTPSFGAAPTSGLDFNGQRGRLNDFLLDGVDASDASVRGIRSTVPQDAVQEFQVLENNFMPEYGRAVGGVVNIVTKSGSDRIHGDAFGFLRDSLLQARDPFAAQAVTVNPTTDEVTGVKQDYTRVQAGASVGGAIQQDKTFYFFSFETNRSEQTGYSSIGANNFGLIPETIPCLPTQVFLTAQQASYFGQAIPAAGGCLSSAAAPLIQTAEIYGAASNTAMNGNVTNVNGPTTFPLPINCNFNVPGNCSGVNVVPLPTSYAPLTSLIGNFPLTDKTDIGSARLDHIWNQNNHSYMQLMVEPSDINGIEVSAQNEPLGQNAGSRTSEQNLLDITGLFHHTTTFSPTLVNELRFQYSRRVFHYDFSSLPGGSNVGVNILGSAYFGREPFSTVDRLERRWEFGDNITSIHGRHTVKFGFDGNLLQLRPTGTQISELDFGGVYDFGALSAASVGLNPSLPSFTAVQAYGLGLPQDYTQGIANQSSSKVQFNDKLAGVFLQDSWNVTPRLTVNYGVRYDVSILPLVAAATSLNQVAEQAMNVVEGIPQDYKNIAPRFGLAWDPRGNGKTVLRASYGIFYDEIPLAVAYDSTSSDGALSSQFEVAGGTPTDVAITPTTSLTALNAASIFQGVVGGIPQNGVCGTNAPENLGYLCEQQRFNGQLASSLFANQNFITQGIPIAELPFSLPVAGNFLTAYAEQAHLSIEHQIARNYSLNISYTFIHGLHLNRSRDINQTNADLLTENYANAIQAGLAPSSPLAVQAPQASPNSCVSTSATSSVQVTAPGTLAEGFRSPNCTGSPLGFIGTAAAFNYFRPSGPNPSFGGANTTGYQQLVTLAERAGYPTGFGVPVAWSDVDQQESSGKSAFNGLTVTLTKRFSNDFQLLSGWTWSHAIDNSTDFSNLLDPQNNVAPNLERGNSDFDQRQRWVTSAVFESPFRWSNHGLLKKLMAHSLIAPIVEISSGRPYDVLTGTDFNLNFSSTTGRPSVVPVGTPGSVTSPYIPNVAFGVPSNCDSGIPTAASSPSGQVVPIGAAGLGCNGNLGRNAFTMPAYFDVDFRYDRKFNLNERANLEFIADGFNLLNRLNVLAVNLLCNPLGGSSTCQAGQPTAAFNPRQFQVALKFNF